MISLKAKLTSLFSSSLMECLHTSKELRRQVRDRVLLMLEEEIQERVGQQQGAGLHQSAVHKTALQFGLSLPSEVDALGRECARCPRLLKERDEAMLKADTNAVAADHYKQQISQLKEITKHHRAIAEGSIKVADGYVQTAANFHDGVSRSDLMKERERILVQNNRMLETSLDRARERLVRAEKNLEATEQELKAQSSMIETLRRELQVTAHSLVAERKKVQEAELKLANLGPNSRMTTFESNSYAGIRTNVQHEDSFLEFEKQHVHLKSAVLQQQLSHEDVASKDMKIKELEEDLATVRQEAGLIARGMGDELSKLTKQLDYMHEENIGMASEIRRLTTELIEANHQADAALSSQRSATTTALAATQRCHNCAESVAPTGRSHTQTQPDHQQQQRTKQAKPQSQLQNNDNIRWQLREALEQVQTLKKCLERTRKLQTDEVFMCKSHVDLKLRQLLFKVLGANGNSGLKGKMDDRDTKEYGLKDSERKESGWYQWGGQESGLRDRGILMERKENVGGWAN